MNPRVYLLALGTFATGTNTFVIVGILPDIARELHAPMSLVGLSAGATAIAYAVSAPLLPALLSRLSQRAIMATSLALFVAILALTTVVDDPYAFLAMRALVGLAAAGYTPQASAVAFSLSAPSARGRAIAAVLLGIVVATAVSVPLGTLIGTMWGYRATLWYVAILGALALVALLAIPEPTRRRAPVSLAAQLHPLTRRDVLATAGTTALISAGSATVSVFFAPLFMATAGLDPSELAFVLGVYGVAGVLAVFLAGRAVDRFGGFAVTCAAVVGLIVTTLALATADVLWSVALVVLLWGLCSSLYGPAQQWELGRLDPEEPAPLFAVNTSSLFLGTALGTGLGSLVLQHGGPGLLPFAACAPLAIALVATFAMLRKRRAYGTIIDKSTRVDNARRPRSKEITMSRSLPATVVVVGSLNQDLTRYVSALPRPGETIFASAAASALGGKGANQAVAAARVGASVRFVGAIGDDLAGRGARAALEAAGVATDGLRTSTTEATGTALITVDARGENTIVVDSGANLSVDAQHATEVVERAGAHAVVLCQGELPAEVIDAVAAATQRAGSRFVLNLAPVIRVAAATLATADPLIVNELEGAQLLGSPEADAAAALQRRHGASVVVTLGGDGARLVTTDIDLAVPASAVAQVVDTTGAGDAFCGVLAAALAFGCDLEQAVRFGVTAGGVAVAGTGTTDSYPTADQLPGWADGARDEGAA
jgi:ribokinase